MKVSDLFIYVFGGKSGLSLLDGKRIFQFRGLAALYRKVFCLWEWITWKLQSFAAPGTIEQNMF